MKKIAYIISAISAGLFTQAANAEISISGSGSFAYTDAGGNSSSIMGGGVSFGLSTTTDAGVTISASSGISLDKDSVGNSSGSTGVTALTFGFANGSITVGDDVGVADGAGKVGEIATWSDTNLRGVSKTPGLSDDEGSGIALSTSLGDIAIGAQYVWDGAGVPGDVDGSTTTSSGISLSMPVGGNTLTLASASDEAAGTDTTEVAGAFTMAMGTGSLAIGATSTDSTDANKEGTAYSAMYSTSLGGVSAKVGYTSYDVNNATGQLTDVVLSSSLGGGASLFAEYSSASGTLAASTATNNQTVIAVGTSVSF
jgi:hypothetical protein